MGLHNDQITREALGVVALDAGYGTEASRAEPQAHRATTAKNNTDSPSIPIWLSVCVSGQCRPPACNMGAAVDHHHPTAYNNYA